MGLGNILQPPTGVGGKSKETSLERPMGSCLCIAASYKLIYPSQSLLYNAQCKYVCQASTHTICVCFFCSEFFVGVDAGWLELQAVVGNCCW